MVERRANEERHRDFLSPGMDGGIEGRGGAGARSEREKTHPTKTEGVSKVGSTHVPRLEDRGDASPTWDETKVVSLRHLTEKLHKEGEVNLREGKARDMIAQVSEMASDGKVAADVKVAQPEASEDMQWEKITRQVKDPTFKFESKSVQNLKGHVTSTGSTDESQSPVAMVYDAKVGWTSKALGPNSKHWKRLARESKGKIESKGLGPENKKRIGPTPLQELDPNAID